MIQTYNIVKDFFFEGNSKRKLENRKGKKDQYYFMHMYYLYYQKSFK